MRLDMHVHTKEGSFDSELPVEQALRKARERGLAGLCITDHESLALRTEAERLSERFGLLVLVGMEYLTTDGDVLVFGLDSVPRGPLSAPELAAHVTSQGGVSVAAHPFRNNGRGMGALFSRVPLHAVESFQRQHPSEAQSPAEALPRNAVFLVSAEATRTSSSGSGFSPRNSETRSATKGISWRNSAMALFDRWRGTEENMWTPFPSFSHRTEKSRQNGRSSRSSSTTAFPPATFTDPSLRTLSCGIGVGCIHIIRFAPSFSFY